MPKGKLTKGEEIYNDAKKLEGEQKYTDALTKYQEASKNQQSMYYICQLAIARMHLQEKAQGEGLVGKQDFIEKGMQLVNVCLTNIDDIESQKKHKEVRQIRNILSEIDEALLSQEYKAKRQYCLAKLDYLTSGNLDNYLTTLIAAVKMGSEEACHELGSRLDKLRHNAKIITLFKKEVFSESDFKGLSVNHLYLIYLLADYLSGLKNTTRQEPAASNNIWGKFGITIEVSSPLEEDEFVRVSSQLCQAASIIISKSSDLKWLIKAVKHLMNEKKLELSHLEKCESTIEEISDQVASEQEFEMGYFCALLGKLLAEFNRPDPLPAVALLKQGLSVLKGRPEYNEFLEALKKLYRTANQMEALDELTRQNVVDPAALFNRAEQQWQDWLTNNNTRALKAAISDYKLAAKNDHIEAAKKIKDIALATLEILTDLKRALSNEEQVPEAILAYADLIETLPPKKISAFGLLPPRKKLTNKKQVNEHVKSLRTQARDAFEKILRLQEEGGKQVRYDIFHILAMMRNRGELYEKNTAFARFLLERAVAHDKDAYYDYARMCFYGEGGPVDVETAKQHAEGIDREMLEQSPEALYLQGEIYYLEYLRACDHNLETKDSLAGQAINCFFKAANLGSKNAIYSLYIFWKYDQEIVAAKRLAEIFERGVEELPVLREVNFSAFPQQKADYAVFIYQQLPDSMLLPTEKVEEYRQKKINVSKQQDEQAESLYNQYCDEILKLERNNNLLKGIAEKLRVLADNDCKLAAYALARYELEVKQNPLPLRNLKSPERYEEQASLLVKFYKNNEDGELKLMTTLCYEARRHEPKENHSQCVWQTNTCKLLFDVLVRLNPRYADHSLKALELKLREHEKTEKRYFEEYQSDDSDGETEKTYQGSDKHVTADVVRNIPLVDKISSETRKKIEEIINAKEIDEKRYTDFVNAVKSLFANLLQSSQLSGLSGKRRTVDTKAKSKIKEDLQTVNHYSAQGKLLEGLKKVSTPFATVQARGYHFLTPIWNKPQRNSFWRNIKDVNHPYLSQAVFSSAVYERAAVNDYTDNSGYVRLRLEKVARYIYLQLLQLNQRDAYQDGQAKMPKGLLNRNFPSLSNQVQQLYSNNYSAVHEFIDEQRQKPEPIFVAKRNPFVSTADLNSIHAYAYAYGNKTYQADEEDRLRPRYDKTGRALHPHSGFVNFTLHTLEDFARPGCHHVPSMNFRHELSIDWTVSPELETSFYSFIDKGRLIYIHPAKYPSFHYPTCPKVFLHAYGINEELYQSFKRLLRETNPHQLKQRLAIFLLGHYLSAYQTLYFMRYFMEKAERLGVILLFRDQHGNFSLKPCYDFSPSPSGDDDRLRLRRYFTFLDRIKTQTSGTPPKGDTPSKRRLSDIDNASVKDDRISIPDVDGEMSSSNDDKDEESETNKRVRHASPMKGLSK